MEALSVAEAGGGSEFVELLGEPVRRIPSHVNGDACRFEAVDGDVPPGLQVDEDEPGVVVRTAGLLSGSGSVIPDLQSALFKAIQDNDLATAKRLNDRIEPLMRTFYADPFVDMHNRMKEALVLLGRIPRAYVRPPLIKIERAEIARIRQGLIEAGLLAKDAGRDAA